MKWQTIQQFGSGLPPTNFYLQPYCPPFLRDGKLMIHLIQFNTDQEQTYYHLHRIGDGFTGHSVPQLYQNRAGHLYYQASWNEYHLDGSIIPDETNTLNNDREMICSWNRHYNGSPDYYEDFRYGTGFSGTQWSFYGQDNGTQGDTIKGGEDRSLFIKQSGTRTGQIIQFIRKHPYVNREHGVRVFRKLWGTDIDQETLPSFKNTSSYPLYSIQDWDGRFAPTGLHESGLDFDAFDTYNITMTEVGTKYVFFWYLFHPTNLTVSTAVFSMDISAWNNTVVNIPTTALTFHGWMNAFTQTTKQFFFVPSMKAITTPEGTFMYGATIECAMEHGGEGVPDPSGHFCRVMKIKPADLLNFGDWCDQYDNIGQ